MPLLFVIGLSLVGILGDYFLKLAGNKTGDTDYKMLILGIFVYMLVGVGWFFALQHLKLSTIGVPYAITIIIGLALMGYFVFHEALTVYEIVGIILGVLSIILLYRFA